MPFNPTYVTAHTSVQKIRLFFMQSDWSKMKTKGRWISEIKNIYYNTTQIT